MGETDEAAVEEERAAARIEPGRRTTSAADVALADLLMQAMFNAVPVGIRASTRADAPKNCPSDAGLNVEAASRFHL